MPQKPPNDPPANPRAADTARRRALALAFPVVQTLRERRSPLRRRCASAWRSLDLRAVDRHRHRHRPRRVHSPVALTRRMVAAADRSGPVWAVTLVRHEQRRSRPAVGCLVAGGVDVVVVADDLSTDGTGDVLDDLARDLPVVVVSDRESALYQGQKMSLLARKAARHGASWIVPFDADELWLGVGGSLAERLRSIDGDAAIASPFDFLPRPGQASAVMHPVDELTWRAVTSSTHKIAFRAHLRGTLTSGNHGVMQPVRKVRGALSIGHYPVLGFDHFVAKARSGAAALAASWREICGQELVEDVLPETALCWATAGASASSVPC